MRVLTVGNMYPPHHLGGYELMWRSSVADLRRRGHEIRVLTTDYRTARPDPGLPEDRDVHRELRWYWRDHAWPRLGLRERRRLERHNLGVLERHLRELRPDAVAWWAMGGMSMSLIERVRRRGVPAAAVVVDDWLLYAPVEDQWQRAVRRLGPLAPLAGRALGVPSTMRFDDALEWVVVSGVILDHARAGGWRLRRHRVAHAGVDRDLFAARPPGPWRGRLLYVGRLDRRKGVHTAIEALRDLPDARLTVVGAGDEDYRVELLALVERLRLGERVGFERRARRELPEAYAGADAVLFPVSWEEPFGIVPLEAMAVGRPVVASGTGGSGEYLRHEENCLLYSPAEDAAALAAAVARLAGDEGLRERLRAGGAATAERFDEAAFNDEVERALERALR